MDCNPTPFISSEHAGNGVGVGLYPSIPLFYLEQFFSPHNFVAALLL